MIFSHLSPGMASVEDSEEVSQSRHTCRKALAASALSCRTLSHHALDVLWRELLAESLHPLLKVLPEYKCVESKFVGHAIHCASTCNP